MKRLMPQSLIAFLQANPNCAKADLFAILLPTGSWLYVTEGQWDITLPYNPVPQVSGGGLAGTTVSSVITIDGRSVPWRDSAYAFPGQSTGLDPASVAVNPGDVLKINYLGGTWSQGGSLGYWGAAGNPATADHPGSGSAGAVIPVGGPVIHSAELLGGWADASGHLVAPPFVVGPSFTGTAPAGATQLVMGMDDGVNFGDNFGSIQVKAIRTTPVQPATGSGGSGGPVTFLARGYGRWSRGPITSEASSKLNSGTMPLYCVPQQADTYPGLTLGIPGAALNHLFDAATVWVFTAYFTLDRYGDVSAGIETKFQGTITRVPDVSPLKVEFECADPLYLCNMKVPSRLVQAACPWSFCDTNCGLTASDYTVGFTASGSSTASTLVPSSAFSQADGYFTQGLVKCLTGDNAGLSATVKTHVSGALQMVVPWLLPVQAGDTFSAIKGCDKTLSTCKTTKKANGTVVDNTVATTGGFGGTPFVPVETAAL